MARGKRKETLTPEERLQAALVPESEQPYKVPGNWCWTFLKPISKIRTGKKDANYGSVIDGEYPFFTCAAEPIRCHGYSFRCNAIRLQEMAISIILAATTVSLKRISEHMW